MYESNTWILKSINISSYLGPRNILPWNYDFSSLLELTD